MARRVARSISWHLANGMLGHSTFSTPRPIFSRTVQQDCVNCKFERACGTQAGESDWRYLPGERHARSV